MYWDAMTDHVDYGLLGDSLQVYNDASFKTSEKFEAFNVEDKVARPGFGSPSWIAKK